ncbi:uncharacterized protein BO80DRAFT_128069 [Aspergillus ibericus CBS 121593]|uniref:Uncharacterized protein n=1 Tax=Aspergillus ibericus CBS 121593 TaxID=1448316 RepID=A0A395GWD3_9EURO|nr:hypothetical protein BO80DRAFT_128069 [Aspergillus ibericus CBS 121593]RAK99328.1 hypothetical protein BO80DRAFT_128069 [Aspergillus ibericus CBS 121593]
MLQGRSISYSIRGCCCRGVVLSCPQASQGYTGRVAAVIGLVGLFCNPSHRMDPFCSFAGLGASAALVVNSTIVYQEHLYHLIIKEDSDPCNP